MGSGVVTRIVQHALGLERAPWSLTGLWAIVFVHAYTMYVYVFLFVSAGLERIDTTLDEAAEGLGASRGFRLRRVTLPLLTPSIAGAMLLVFMSALGSFSPLCIRRRPRVLSTQIVARIKSESRARVRRDDGARACRRGRSHHLRRFERRRSYAMRQGPQTRVIGPRRWRVRCFPLASRRWRCYSAARDGRPRVVRARWSVDEQVLPPEYTLTTSAAWRRTQRSGSRFATASPWR